MHPTTDDAPPSPPRRPSWGFMLRHPAHIVALGAGAGLAPVAAGTLGTLWAWWLFDYLAAWLHTPALMGAFLLMATLVGWWAATLTAHHLGRADPGCIVWDEMVAMWLILWIAAPTSWWGECGAFLLFRFFDAVKPQPVRWADSIFKGFGKSGGWGIMWDDLVAAFCTLLVLAWWRF